MKLNGVSSILFLFVTCAYAGKYYKKHNRRNNSSSSSSSDISPCGPEFAECFRPRHEKKAFDKCKVFEPEKVVVCEPPRRRHYKTYHHQKGISKEHCNLFGDIQCLVGNSYLGIGHSLHAQLGELASSVKSSVDSTSNKVTEKVSFNLKRLEKVVLEDDVKDPLLHAIKKITNVIVETNKFLEESIDALIDDAERDSSNYINGIIALTNTQLLVVVRDTVGGLLPTIQHTFRDLEIAVKALIEEATVRELDKVLEIGKALVKDIEKRISKDFLDAEVLVKSLLEKIFEKEGSHLRDLIERRLKIVEHRIRHIARIVDQEIAKAISCSEERECKTIQTKLEVFDNSREAQCLLK